MSENKETSTIKLNLDAIIYPEAPDNVEETEPGKLVLNETELQLSGDISFSLSKLKNANYENINSKHIIKITTTSENEIYFGISDANKVKYITYVETINDSIQNFISVSKTDKNDEKNNNNDNSSSPSNVGSNSKFQQSEAPTLERKHIIDTTQNDAPQNETSQNNTSQQNNTPQNNNKDPLLNIVDGIKKQALNIVGFIKKQTLKTKIVGICALIAIVFLMNLCSGYDPKNAPFGDEEYLAYHKKYCDKNIGYACNQVGIRYIEMHDEESAILYYEKACRLKFGVGCENLGNTYVRKDNIKAAEYFKKACDYSDYDDGQGCSEFADLLIVSNDKSRAFEYYKKSCDKRYGRGCYAVGLYYAAGDSFVTKNMTKAREYFRKGCKYGHKLSCDEL